jgi:hypothetical protein
MRVNSGSETQNLAGILQTNNQRIQQADIKESGGRPQEQALAPTGQNVPTGKNSPPNQGIAASGGGTQAPLDSGTASVVLNAQESSAARTATDIISKQDNNRDGSLDFKEFLGKGATDKEASAAKEIFDSIDSNGDGKVTHAELKTDISKAAPEAASKAAATGAPAGGATAGGASQLSAKDKRLDTNKDGIVTAAERAAGQRSSSSDGGTIASADKTNSSSSNTPRQSQSDSGQKDDDPSSSSANRDEQVVNSNVRRGVQAYANASNDLAQRGSDLVA